MTDDTLNPDDAGGDEPDTGTGDEFGTEAGAPIPAAIPVAEPTFTEPPAPAAPPPPAGPRIYPQQYTLLFANTMIVVGCLTVWERAHVAGRDMYGFQMIGGAFVLAWAAYSMLASVVGLVRGGVNMFGSLGTGFFAFYFAIRNLLHTIGLENFKYYGDFKNLGITEHVNAFLGQFGPGVHLNLIGGGVILLLFFKAMFGGKKKEPEPARGGARRGRR